MWERIRNIAVKEIIQLLRDRKMIAVVFVIPLFQLLIFGYAVTTDINTISVAVYDLDHSFQSRDLVRRFRFSPYFTIKKYIINDKDQMSAFDKTHVEMVLRINRGFGRDIKAQHTASVQCLVDGTEANNATIIRNYATQIIEGYAAQLKNNKSLIGAQPVPRVELRTRAWFNANLKSRNFFLPGIVAQLIMLTTLLLSAMAIVKEKEIGTIEQLIVSPIKPFELILGKLLPFAFVGLVVASVVITAVLLWFKVPLRGSVFLLFCAAVFYLFTTLGVGLFLSTIASTQQEAMMLTFFFLFPSVLLSGFSFPIANMPKVIQYITWINPMKYFIIILRGIFLKGSGFNILWPQMAALFIIGIVVLSLSIVRFSKRLG